MCKVGAAEAEKRPADEQTCILQVALIQVEAVVLHLSSRSRAADRQSHGGGWRSHSVDPPSKIHSPGSCPIRALGHWLLPIPVIQTDLSSHGCCYFLTSHK